MSYCRVSSDNWKSDVYAWADVAGHFAISVASIKCDGEPIPFPDDAWEKSTEEFNRLHKIHMESYSKLERIPIGGIFDGEYLKAWSYEEFYAVMIQLREAGYHVPQSALDRIDEEYAFSEKPKWYQWLWHRWQAFRFFLWRMKWNIQDLFIKEE